MLNCLLKKSKLYLLQSVSYCSIKLKDSRVRFGETYKHRRWQSLKADPVIEFNKVTVKTGRFTKVSKWRICSLDRDWFVTNWNIYWIPYFNALVFLSSSQRSATVVRARNWFVLSKRAGLSNIFGTTSELILIRTYLWMIYTIPRTGLCGILSKKSFLTD